MSGSTGSPYRALVGRGSHHADFQGVARARARRPAKEALITPRRRGARPAIRERAPLIRLACVTPQQPTQHGGTRLLPHVARQARGSFRGRSLTHISAPRSRYTAECGVVCRTVPAVVFNLGARGSSTMCVEKARRKKKDLLLLGSPRLILRVPPPPSLLSPSSCVGAPASLRLLCVCRHRRQVLMPYGS